jgi:hypothetical protein
VRARRPARAQSGAIPTRKISETIIDFGAPLIEQLDADQPLEVLRSALSLVITVWNAHVLALPAWGSPQSLAQLEELVRASGTAPEMMQMYRELGERRRQHFANDPRAVGEWSLTVDQHGQVRFKCDARVPPSVRPKGS